MVMTDRSSIWIGLADLLLCVVSVALVAVHPKSLAQGVEQKAEYLVTASWPNTIDADVDVWLVGPSGRPTYYGARDVGCARLDQDDRGFLDGLVRLADGTEVKVDAFRETVSIRCIEPGRYDAAVALYAYHDHSLVGDARVGPDEGRPLGVPVHVELVQLNPEVKVLYARDVTLDRVSQSVNTLSFDLARVGKAAMADPPLGPVVERWQKVSP
jgi:hypothetical protein